MDAATVQIEARRFLIGGRVQGVGFRPFVHRLAMHHRLDGWVRNRVGEVEIHAQGDAAALDVFARALVSEAPPLARPTLLSTLWTTAQAIGEFAILPSEAATAPDLLTGRTSEASRASLSGRGPRLDPIAESMSRPRIHVPPDYFVCDDCLQEMGDARNRRYRYPFINCTQCGPRYTLIERLPYDRPNTTMAAFALCPGCRREYEDPLDWRYHAEPIACPVCGPQLTFVAHEVSVEDSESAIASALRALRNGRIVAVKGIGGYHLMCDARNDAAIARLRALKPRPHKPLAVLIPRCGADGLDAVRAISAPTDAEARLLADPARPIVLVKKLDNAPLSALIAPGLGEIGAFLPYSPLHQILLADFGGPLIATSANVSGEPVLTDNDAVEKRLAHVADAFLHHDRPIARPADDSVYRVIADAPRPLRLGRGSAPLELELPFTLDKPSLAVGGHMKGTVALAWENRVVISPHIGDLDTPRSVAIFEQVIADLQELYGVRAEYIVHDVHPGYASTRYARQGGLPARGVYHHHAHASALAGEFPGIERWLMFTWDGVGFGADGTLWGGEALLGKPSAWRRVASFRPFHLPGGEKVAREPWRAALALCWETGIEWDACPEETQLLREAWRRGINAPQSSAVGRLFDAAAALTGINMKSSFEGQGPMMFEALASAGATPIPLPLAPDAQGLPRTDWAPLLPMLMDESRTAADRACVFHVSLAQALVAQATAIRTEHGAFTVGLNGGVFQNRALAEMALAGLTAAGFDARFPSRLPCNDGGLCYGQIVEHAGR